MTPPLSSISSTSSIDSSATWTYTVSNATDTQLLARKFGEPTQSQLDKINTIAKRPLGKEDVFVFTSKMVGDALIPERLMKLHKSLLEKFKVDTQRGISLLLDHSWSGFFARPKAAFAYGRSFDAVLRKGDQEGEDWALYGDYYMVRNRELDGIKTDQLIAQIEDGTMFDTSIGWGCDTYECSVCGNDIRSSKCEHWPGKTYDEKLCYVVAKPPGFCMENSLVFDGAYATAGVLSAVGAVNEQGAYQQVTDIKSVRAGIPLFHATVADGSLRSFARKEDLGPKTMLTVTPLKGGEVMPKEEVLETMEVIEEATPAVAQEVAPEPLAPEPIAETAGFFVIPMRDVPQVLSGYGVDAILTLAKDGISYRRELVKDALEWGVRAMGNNFALAQWEQILNEGNRTVDEIRTIRDSYKQQALDTVTTGRKTAPQTQMTPKPYAIPDAALKMGTKEKE